MTPDWEEVWSRARAAGATTLQPVRSMDDARVVAAGRNVVICGPGRDVARHLEGGTIDACERLGSLFGNHRILVLENGSVDDTLDVCRRWSERNRRVSVVILRDVPGQRTERMAFLRQQIAERVLEALSELMIAVDLDDAGRTLETDTVLSCFRYEGWDMFGANQRGRYYDIWALRCRGWIDYNCWERIGRDAARIGLAAARRVHLRPHRLDVPPDAPPIEVASCFGGCGVYRVDKLRGCRYDGRRGTDCEHVAFHREMRDKHGARLFINPAMLNSRNLQRARPTMQVPQGHVP